MDAQRSSLDPSVKAPCVEVGQRTRNKPKTISVFRRPSSPAQLTGMPSAALRSAAKSIFLISSIALKDRYGLSWQVVPTGMEELFADPDKGRAERAMA
jgi:hypothetical protein